MGDWVAAYLIPDHRPEVRIQRATLARVWGRAPQGSEEGGITECECDTGLVSKGRVLADVA